MQPQSQAPPAGAQRDMFGNVINPNFVVPRQPAPQQASQGVHGRGGFLSSIISELGGAGGAAGGAAIGTALFPGIGTIIGGGLGGLIGGFGGKAVEQKVRDNQNVFGAGGSFKKDLTEGGTDAVLSAAGEAASGLKAAKAAGEPLSAIFSSSPQELKAAAEAGGAGAGALSNIGSGLRTEVVNPKVAASPFGAAQEKGIVNTLNDLGLKGSAASQYKQLPGVMSDLGGKIDGALAQNTNSTTFTNLLDSIKGTAKDLPQFVGADNAYNKSLTTELQDLAGKTGTGNLTAANLQAAKTDLSSKMGSIFTKVSKGADLNPKEASRLAIWKGLDSSISDVAPEVKALTQQQSKLYEAAPGLLKNANKSAGIPILGVKSKGAEQLIQGGQDLGGRVLQGAGKLSTGTGGVISKVAQQAKFQAPGDILRTLGSGPLPAQNDQGIAPTSPANNFGLGGGLAGAIQPPTPTQSQYPISQALQDIARDPKNTSTYLAINKAADAAATAQDTQNGGSAQQQKAVYGVQNAMQTLDNVQKQFGAAGGGQGALAGRIANLGSKVNINSNLAAYNSLKTDAALQLAVGLFGATAGRSPQIIGYIRNSLPDAQDSPAVANQKINDLRQRLLSVYGDTANYGQMTGAQPGVYDPTQNPSAFNQQQQSALAGGF